MIPLELSLGVGLIVLSTAAGAPFLPKLVQGAKGNIALGVGLILLPAARRLGAASQAATPVAPQPTTATR